MVGVFNINFVSVSVAVLGYSDGSVGGAIIAVILIHLVIAMFVYKAWSEGQSPTPIKQD